MELCFSPNQQRMVEGLVGGSVPGDTVEETLKVLHRLALQVQTLSWVEVGRVRSPHGSQDQGARGAHGPGRWGRRCRLYKHRSD